MLQPPIRIDPIRPGWQSSVFISTKLHPPRPHADWLARTRLIERLHSSAHCPLTLISAPAGYGKTSLLAEWRWSAENDTGTGQTAPLFAWISLDEHDNNPANFLTYLLTAIEAAGLPISHANASKRGDDLGSILGSLIHATSLSTSPVYIILDDYHHIHEPLVHEIVAFLAAHMPAQMHLILSSRSDPPLPLAQSRARGQLVELRTSDLKFTAAETERLFNEKLGFKISSEEAQELEGIHAGWVAGLLLTALASRTSTTNERAGFGDAHVGKWGKDGGCHRYIADYLAEQVFDRQPLEIQQFLLETSILQRVSGPLCDAVTGSDHSQDILERLERENLFLFSSDNRREWFAYHPLFATFLQERLHRVHPARWPDLHRSAAEWCEQNGLTAEAVEHTLAVGDSIQAAELMEQIAESIWLSGETTRLLGWMEALPEPIIRSRPRLLIFYAWILNILGDYEAVSQRLEAAAVCLQRTELPPVERDTVTGMLAATRAIISLMEGRIDLSLEDTRTALRLLPADKWIWQSVVARNLGNIHYLSGQTLEAAADFQDAFEKSQKGGNTYLSLVSLYELAELFIVMGKLRQAHATLLQAMEIAEARGSPGLTIAGSLHVGMSEVLREWNDLETGAAFARRAVEIGLRGNSLGLRVCSYTRLGMIAEAAGDMATSQQAYNLALQLAPHQQRTSFIAHMQAQARLCSRLSDLEVSERWLLENGIDPGGNPDCLTEAGYLALARVYLRSDREAQALSLLARLLSFAESGGRQGRIIEILALQASALYALQRTGEAFTVLERALALAEPEGHLRVFLDQGEPLTELLRLLETRLRSPRLRDYAKRLASLAHAPPLLTASASSFPVITPRSGPPLPVEPLSDREIEVLRGIAAGLSNQEIAHKLVVAPSTVNWHVKNIYSKLDVHSRTQAIHRARELAVLA